MNSLATLPILHRLQLASCPCDRPSHRPTPASSSPSLSPSSAHAAKQKPCDHPSHRPNLRTGDRNIPSFSPCDRQNISLPLPQCKTPSLRRGSGKRSACLSTFPSVQTFGATWPKDHALNFWVPLGAVVEGRSAEYYSLSPQGMPSAERCDSFLSEIAIQLIGQGF